MNSPITALLIDREAKVEERPALVPVKNPIARVTSPRPATRWQAFRRHRLGYWSLILLVLLYATSLCAEFVSNNKPLLISYQGEYYFPLLKDYPESTFGGDLPIQADYLDPFIRERLQTGGNFALYPLNPYRFDTISYYAKGAHHPSAPSSDNLLGTDPTGYDILAQLIYGFRISVSFALALTVVGTLLGVVIGAIQGYFAGKVDLVAQRLIEVWGAMPELYLLIIFASLFNQSFIVLFLLMTLFGWVHASDYVRAEFLRNRQLEYVKAARALGLSSIQIMVRHILPNSLTPVITYLPFRMSAGIMALASLDFLGLGVSDAPSIGRMLLQGKENLDAWWISVAAFGALVTTMLLLTFIGEALRDALNLHSASRRVGRA
ncbi:microcin C transport system permease protein [Sphingomonas zeicaulis]|uniref:ABC transporter permease n=1 Tax=Sphingomonas zeicaulis TaxID=1632740 RepID=UPI003D1C0B15